MENNSTFLFRFKYIIQYDGELFGLDRFNSFLRFGERIKRFGEINLGNRQYFRQACRVRFADC